MGKIECLSKSKNVSDKAKVKRACWEEQGREGELNQRRRLKTGEKEEDGCKCHRHSRQSKWLLVLRQREWMKSPILWISDFGPSSDVVSWWPPSWDVIIPWAGSPPKRKKRMNEIPNIVIPAPGGQRVGTPPPPRLRSISLNLQSPAADPLWIHSIQLVPPWIQYSMWTHLLYHHSGCRPLCTSTVPVSPPLCASIVPPPLCRTTLAVGPIALSLNAARGHHTHLQSSKWTPSGFVFIQLSFQFFCG